MPFSIVHIVYRTPFLLHNPEVRQTLMDSGFLYDSSITEQIGRPISPDTAHIVYPYSLDNGIPYPETCNTGGGSAASRQSLCLGQQPSYCQGTVFVSLAW